MEGNKFKDFEWQSDIGQHHRFIFHPEAHLRVGVLIITRLGH